MYIYIIRHGETDSNKERRFQGWTDCPLNGNGKAMAGETAALMEPVHFDAAFSSPLERAYQTAGIVLNNSGNSTVPLITDDRLKEINMGTLEGTVVSENPEALKFFDNPLASHMTFPQGESVYDLIDRTSAFLEDLVSGKLGICDTAEHEASVLVSVHGASLRAILNRFYDDPSDFWQGRVPPNCSISILRNTGGDINNTTLIAKDRVYYKITDRKLNP